MNKCNNCVKFLTCNRTECNQITYLQANQIERLEVKEIDISLETDFRKFKEAVCMAGTTLKQVLENLNFKKTEREK